MNRNEFDTFRDNLNARVESDQAALSLRLDTFASGLTTKLGQYQEAIRAYDLKTASDFNVFSFIRPDENRLSDMFAFLLDPGEAHGQRRLAAQSQIIALAGERR